jgi:hypothetical protein
MRLHSQQWFVTARHRGRRRPGGDDLAPPYGIQHARQAGSHVALCGEAVVGWVFFWHLSFAADAPDSCPACSEVIKQGAQATATPSGRSRLHPR